MRIIVCQAAYGDTLGIEIDPTPPQTLDNDQRIKVGEAFYLYYLRVLTMLVLESNPEVHPHRWWTGNDRANGEN
jgi:hypothetical protein